ncbi:hypothetical protein BJY21_002791 [Kineosphaera limosa]|uniref:Uncharacterized protein n=1 Tax=Kineosphaera limosa NBRC 100340 TaxID=1184609 RepID=K6XEU9_9MICO|nr:hypothetical protein [Kineosphaera limosa]NYE01607.1 hypothetical protein [Kineosphaera limosa]GAB97319.1 hypothetical protein KILIM_064_00120 [Kineosphaera limosa NBRC 100340]
MTDPDRDRYSAPIPPVEGQVRDETRADREGQPRYIKSEPMPPRNPFEQMMGGRQAPGGQPGMPPGLFAMQTGQPVSLGRKSLLLATVLAGVLGPLGMLYSTFLGAFVMTGVWFWTLFLAQPAVPFVWIWGMVWALWAAHRKNERRRMVEAHLAQW